MAFVILTEHQKRALRLLKGECNAGCSVGSEQVPGKPWLLRPTSFHRPPCPHATKQDKRP